MTYEEKRELRLQISQLLADAGLNQKAIKDMVETEIKNDDIVFIVTLWFFMYYDWRKLIKYIISFINNK